MSGVLTFDQAGLWDVYEGPLIDGAVKRYFTWQFKAEPYDDIAFRITVSNEEERAEFLLSLRPAGSYTHPEVINSDGESNGCAAWVYGYGWRGSVNTPERIAHELQSRYSRWFGHLKPRFRKLPA